MTGANAGLPMGRWEDQPRPRPVKDQKIRAAGILIMAPDGRALFLRRSGQGDHPGEWGIPGGTVEPHELPVQAAIREVQEETGFQINNPSNLRLIDHNVNPDVDYTTFLIHVRRAFTPKLNDEHNGHAWVELESAPKPTHPGVAHTIKNMGKDNRVDRGDTVRDTIKFPAPENKDGERAIDSSFARGKRRITIRGDGSIVIDERYDEESAIAPEAAQLNSTTMDEVALSPQQKATYERMAPQERAQVDAVLKEINGHLSKDPKESMEYRDKLDQLLGRAYVGEDDQPKNHPQTLQQAEFPAFLMCAPFALNVDKPDNVWMEKFNKEEDDKSEGKNEIDKNMAFSEWMNLYTYISSRALVYVLPSQQGLQDQVYVANLGLVLPHKKDRTVVVANFKAPPRRGEDKIGEPFFKALGYKTVHAPKYWEGEAECKYIRDNLFVGAHGIRSSMNSITWLRDNFDMDIIPVKMIDERLYHLDTLLFPLTRDKVITCTKFMEPRDVKALEKHVEIIDVSREDTLRGITCGIRLNNVFLVNTLLETLHKSHELYAPEVHKKETAEKICRDNGIECKLFNLSEAEKSGADLACHIMHLNWVEGNSPPGSAIEPDQAADDWKESDHPRAANGQFGSGGSGGATAEVNTKQSSVRSYGSGKVLGGNYQSRGGSKEHLKAVEDATKLVPQAHRGWMKNLNFVSAKNVGKVLSKEQLNKLGINVGSGNVSRGMTDGKNVVIMENYTVPGKKFFGVGFNKDVKIPFSVEGTVLHELGHVIDKAQKGRLSGTYYKDAMQYALARMEKDELKDAAYFLNDPEEMFAELYAAAFSPRADHLFGGMTRDRVEEVFAKPLAMLRNSSLG